MKKLLVTVSLFLAFLLSGCASTDGSGFAGFEITHPDPVTEMTKSACCRIPPK